jgi:hypothetical protein
MNTELLTLEIHSNVLCYQPKTAKLELRILHGLNRVGARYADRYMFTEKSHFFLSLKLCVPVHAYDFKS